MSKVSLSKAVQALSTWISEKPDEVAAQKAALDYYGQLFRPENVKQITEDDFKAFLLVKNNKHWAGIHRHPNVYADMSRLRKALAFLVDDSNPVQERLDAITDKAGPYYVRGLGRAILTPILMCVYQNQYAVYNRISEEALTWLGRNKVNAHDSLGNRYLSVNASCHEIAAEINQPLRLVDAMFSLLVHGASSPLQGLRESEPALSEPDDVAVSPVTDEILTFPLEKYLEDFLVSNWEKTALGKHLALHSDDEEDATQYPTTVGYIDILARDKANGDWVVIELKKGKHSDAVVGQLLRYMGWVKKHKATDGEKVRGIIITNAPDDKIKYAMLVNSAISFYTYQVKFDLISEMPA